MSNGRAATRKSWRIVIGLAAGAILLPASSSAQLLPYGVGKFNERPAGTRSVEPSLRHITPSGKINRFTRKPMSRLPSNTSRLIPHGPRTKIPNRIATPDGPIRIPGDHVRHPHRPPPGWRGPHIPSVIGVVPSDVEPMPPGNHVTILDDDGPGPGERVRSPKSKKLAARPPQRRIAAPQPRSRPRPTGVPATNERRYEQNEVVIEITGTPSQADLAAIAGQHRLTRLASQQFAVIDTTLYRWRIDDNRSVPDVIRELERDPRIASVQPNYRFDLQAGPVGNVKAPPADEPGPSIGDPAQYAIAKLHLDKAHRLATGEDVLVAVIDSAIDRNHPELAGVIVKEFDAVGGEFTPHTHGTGMTGAIAAHARLMGVAPRVRILAARAFAGRDGTEGTSFAIYKSLDWAIAAGARIVNMSFAGPRDPLLARLMAAAHKKGVVLIAAAGNDGPNSPPLYPAADVNVIAVSATDAQDKLFEKSNRGDYLAVAAPGVDILVPAPNAAYAVTSGTSVAAAQISGIAALLIERDRSLTPDKVREILMATAKDLGPKGKDDEFGAGLADAYEAILAVQPKTAEKAATK